MKNLFVKYIALLGLSVILLMSGCQLTAAGMTITSTQDATTSSFNATQSGNVSPALNLPLPPTLTTLPAMSTTTTQPPTTTTYFPTVTTSSISIPPPVTTTRDPIIPSTPTIIPNTDPPVTTTSTLPPSVPQVVVAELFIREGCQYCPEAVREMEKLTVYYPDSKLIVLEYHIQDEFTTSETESLFYSYTLTGPPTVVFMGGIWEDPEMATHYGRNLMQGPYTFAEYQTRYNLIKGEQSSVLIEASLSTSSMKADVKITNLSSATLVNYKVYAVVYKDRYTKTQLDGYDYMVEDVTDSKGLSLNGGSSLSFQLNSSIKNTSSEHMVIIVKDDRGLIVQALKIK